MTKPRYCTTVFAENIIKNIEAKLSLISSINIPEFFKVNWFENIRYEDEKNAEDCILDSDGFWIEKVKSGHDGKSHGATHFQKFWWRIAPNYCVHGQPSYSSERIAQIYLNSETRKDIMKLNDFCISLEWDGFDMPTKTNWGLRMQPIHITVYHKSEKVFNGMSIHQRGWKKEFIEFIEEYGKYGKK